MATAHIESEKEDIAKVVLMPGDPLRAKYIAENYLTDIKMVNTVRNMTAYTGYYKGERITVFPSGMGVPSIGIYAHELYMFYDVEKIIRIGTCGSFNKDIKILDVILSSGSFCKSYYDELIDGVDLDFVQSSSSLNELILEEASKKNMDLKYGKTITSDVFDLYSDDKYEFRKNFPDMNFLSVEMEAYGLFYIAKKQGKEAACLMTVVDSLFDKRNLSSEEREKSLDQMISLALDSVINK